MRALSLPALVAFTLLIACLLPAQDRAALFAEAAATKVVPNPSVRGDQPDWFFPVREVKHLATGRFWEKPWEEVAANQTDPLPGIVEFHTLLAARGIRLLVVPVPAKASIYPETLVAGFQAGEVAPLAPFLQRLTEAGVEVLDLEPAFLQTRAGRPDQLLYCRQDAHFSPAAAEIIPALVARQIPFEGTAGPGPYTLGEPVLLTFTGDQIAGSEWEGSVAPETQPLRQVSQGGVVGVAPDPASPVLLLGDSHTLVFHEGAEAGMHCSGAGVLDHLALRYGFAPDLVGVRGSGLVQARKQLFYKAAATPGYWDGKKLVIWLFSAREFTQSTDKPVAIPLTK